MLEQDKIDAAVATLLDTDLATAYPALGSVASLPFYLTFQVNIVGGKTFEGKAGGVSVPGGGTLLGDVYTDDVNRLDNSTATFQFNATPVYLNINFFDDDSNFLGRLQSAGISSVLRSGGGSGGWVDVRSARRSSPWL